MLLRQLHPSYSEFCTIPTVSTSPHYEALKIDYSCPHIHIPILGVRGCPCSAVPRFDPK